MSDKEPTIPVNDRRRFDPEGNPRPAQEAASDAAPREARAEKAAPPPEVEEEAEAAPRSREGSRGRPARAGARLVAPPGRRARPRLPGPEQGPRGLQAAAEPRARADDRRREGQGGARAARGDRRARPRALLGREGRVRARPGRPDDPLEPAREDEGDRHRAALRRGPALRPERDGGGGHGDDRPTRPKTRRSSPSSAPATGSTTGSSAPRG